MEKTEFRYTDRIGTIVGTMTNDGADIRIKLDGWEFVGKMFDDMEPVQSVGLPDRFLIHQDSLVD
tara:strand:- start:1520 stop:1714 length:195 start_codon:yes stop_codon:yes gene_type:complete